VRCGGTEFTGIVQPVHARINVRLDDDDNNDELTGRPTECKSIRGPT